MTQTSGYHRIKIINKERKDMAYTYINVHQRQTLAEDSWFKVKVRKSSSDYNDYMTFNIKFSDSDVTFFIKPTECCSVEEEFDMFAEKLSKALYESKYI
jgi:hypothetical protein